MSEMLDKSIGTEGMVYGRLEHGDCVRIANTGEGAIVSMLKFMSEQRHELYEHRERLLVDKGELCDTVADLQRQLAEARAWIVEAHEIIMYPVASTRALDIKAIEWSRKVEDTVFGSKEESGE